MAIENQAVRMFRGNRHVLSFTVVDSDGVTPLTWPGDVKFAVCRVSSSGAILTSSPLIEKITPTEVVLPAAGTATVTLIEADTLNLQSGTYYFELEAFDSTPEGVVVATGLLTILPNIENQL